MNIFCLKRGINQSEEEQSANIEKLRDSIAHGSENEGGMAVETAEQGQQLQQALDLLASGTLESICFRSPDVLARSDDEIANLMAFLSEHDIGLTVPVSVMGPNPAVGSHGRDGADADDIDDVEAL